MPGLYGDTPVEYSAESYIAPVTIPVPAGSGYLSFLSAFPIPTEAFLCYIFEFIENTILELKEKQKIIISSLQDKQSPKNVYDNPNKF
ncbi:hypothetical protein [Pseudogracilibacillus auburnensis]|uniref:hypothetical protein n=1 Tax=Pseudogracilibacillus auburnensis TaxID=1494959 RepID=UPI001A9675A8|nr:hypothetical protein [Pseudogracilibacillus auburnensis]MBO1005978.1 hypothetical protein [Pseudogracilibacillus auburnensis]